MPGNAQFDIGDRWWWNRAGYTEGVSRIDGVSWHCKLKVGGRPMGISFMVIQVLHDRKDLTMHVFL